MELICLISKQTLSKKIPFEIRNDVYDIMNIDYNDYQLLTSRQVSTLPKYLAGLRVSHFNWEALKQFKLG
jgi:hypothetical protein